MFPVTITIHNAVQLNAVINAMDGLPTPKNPADVGGGGGVHGVHFTGHNMFDGSRDTPTTTGRTTGSEEQTANKPKAKATEPKKPTPEPEQPSSPSTGTTSESEQSEAQLGTGELAGDEKAYTMKDAQAMTKEAVVTGKRDAVIALLAKYNVEKTVHLKPEQVQPFCVEIEGLLK